MAPVYARSNLSQTQTAGPYRIELQILPPEPFYTAAQVKMNHIKSGMLVVGGAAPVQLNDLPNPNHHLIVHVFDATTGQVVSNAQVTLSYTPVDSSGDSLGMANDVPVVIMQAIGAGPKSTHYGNNVYLVPTTYSIVVHVNGQVARFRVTV